MPEGYAATDCLKLGFDAACSGEAPASQRLEQAKAPRSSQEKAKAQGMTARDQAGDDECDSQQATHNATSASDIWSKPSHREGESFTALIHANSNRKAPACLFETDTENLLLGRPHVMSVPRVNRSFMILGQLDSDSGGQSFWRPFI